MGSRFFFQTFVLLKFQYIVSSYPFNCELQNQHASCCSQKIRNILLAWLLWGCFHTWSRLFLFHGNFPDAYHKLWFSGISSPHGFGRSFVEKSPMKGSPVMASPSKVSPMKASPSKFSPMKGNCTSPGPMTKVLPISNLNPYISK